VAVSTDIGSFIYCINGPVGFCHGVHGHAAAASIRRAAAGSVHTVPCLNDCRFHGPKPSIFVSPTGGRAPVQMMSSSRSKRLPQ
jgi:hypothetical protein